MKINGVWQSINHEVEINVRYLLVVVVRMRKIERA